MIIILNIFTILISTALSVNSIQKILNRRQSIMDLCIVVFFVSQVVPIAIELFSDVEKIRNVSPVIYEAMIDETVAVIYDVLTIITLLIFWNEGRKRRGTSRSLMLAEKAQMLNVGSALYFLISLGIFIPPIFVIIFAPNRSVYYTFSHFYTNSTVRTSVEYLYHISLVNTANLISLGFIMLAYFLNSRKGIINNLHIIIGLIICTWIDGKRGFLVYALVGIFIIDYIKQNYEAREFARKIFGFAIIIIGYFVIYGLLTGKNSNADFFTEYTFYFSRLNAVKLAIFDKLYDNRMLQYSFQTILFDLLFFVPRTIWPNKPVMYCKYFTAYAYYRDGTRFVSGNFLVNIWAEFISNIGILGYLVAIVLIIIITRRIEKSRLLIPYYSGLAFILIYLVFGFESVVLIVYSLWIVSSFLERSFSRVRFRFGHKSRE